MNYRNAAEQVRSRGRDEDTMLVHMTPGEVRGLQQIAMAAGGSLTVNPDTGLPEAGFLKSLLPMIAGAVLTPLTGGLINPLTAGMLVGAGTGLATGDVGKGLMAGLSAYGGGTLGQALMTAGTGSVAGLGSGLAKPAAMNATPTFSGIGAGVKSLAQPGGMSNLGAAFKEAAGSKLGLAAAGMGLAGPLMANMARPQAWLPQQEQGTPYGGPYVPTPRAARYPGERDPNDSSEFQYYMNTNPVPGYQPMYAGGGIVALKNGSFVVDARTVSELGNGSSNAGQEVLAKIGGKPIRGPGDGVSDSIPAMIAGGQEARVARDEVKFDPEAVKMLGRGNAKRGADKLYSIMEKAHKARKRASRGEDTGLGALLRA